MDLIFTGRNLPEEVRKIADCIYSIQREKETLEILAQGFPDVFLDLQERKDKDGCFYRSRC